MAVHSQYPQLSFVCVNTFTLGQAVIGKHSQYQQLSPVCVNTFSVGQAVMAKHSQNQQLSFVCVNTLQAVVSKVMDLWVLAPWS
jgi:hypothetical protein